MNNINTNSHSENLEKSSRWNKLPYTLLLVSLLSLNNPAEAKALDTYNFSQQSVEVLADSSIVSNIERRTWTILPRMYADKIKNFVRNSKVVEGSGATFTENFIVNQMKSNWWISKQNQLLFIWDAVYEQITKKNFYDWEDWDSDRLSEFEIDMDSIENCWKKYKEWFTSYMKQRSDEANRRSDEANRRSDEANRRSDEANRRSDETKYEAMRLDSLWLKEIARFYSKYKEKPNLIKSGEVTQFTTTAKNVIKNCKFNWINYKAILLREVWWDKKKLDELLKFYGIE